jgi:hypothetical protein
LTQFINVVLEISEISFGSSIVAVVPIQRSPNLFRDYRI